MMSCILPTGRGWTRAMVNCTMLGLLHRLVGNWMHELTYSRGSYTRHIHDICVHRDVHVLPWNMKMMH